MKKKSIFVKARNIRLLMIALMFVIIGAFASITAAYGLEGEEPVLDVRSDLFDNGGGIVAVQPGILVDKIGSIQSLGSAAAMVEILPTVIMLQGDSYGMPVAPYPASRDFYKYGYQVVNPNQNVAENGFLIYDELSFLAYQDYLSSGYTVPPVLFLKLPEGLNKSNDPRFAGRDRYFLMFPAAGDNVEEGYSATQFNINFETTLDLTAAGHYGGNEWNGAYLITSELLVGKYDVEDMKAVFGLSDSEIGSLTYGMTPYVDLIRPDLSDVVPSPAKISALQVSGRPGETVTVPILLEDNPGLAGLQLEIGYDPLLILESADSVKRGPALGDLIFAGLDQETYVNNPFKVVWANIVNDYSRGEILYITFTIPETAEDGIYPVTLSYVPSNTCDLHGVLVPTSTSNGSVTVFSYVYGDVDGSGEVTVFDAILILQYLNNWPVNINLSAADVDGDGEVNIFDVILILQYLNDWFDKFPIE